MSFMANNVVCFNGDISMIGFLCFGDITVFSEVVEKNQMEWSIHLICSVECFIVICSVQCAVYSKWLLPLNATYDSMTKFAIFSFTFKSIPLHILQINNIMTIYPHRSHFRVSEVKYIVFTKWWIWMIVHKRWFHFCGIAIRQV